MSIITADSRKLVKDVEWPSVLSDDANERKLARRRRIEKRVAAIELEANREKGDEVEEEKRPVETQMEKSCKILETFLRESQDYLENVRVANEGREIDRRESEGIGREKVMAQLESEAAEAQKRFDEIADKWTMIHDYKDPLRINEDILLQKLKCDELIRQKDDIIETLKKEIKSAEWKFTKDQTKQNRDIQILAQRIEKQIDFMKKAYDTEFTLIDRVINEEKEKFIEGNNEKWEDLYRKRNEEETSLSEYRFRKQAEMAENIRNLSISHEEQYRTTKIRLEIDIQNAQNEFEKIKSIALSNGERLDYNYQVLKRRENENLIIKSQQKRKLSKLQDSVSDLKSTLYNYRESTSKQIKKTRSEIEKLRKSIVDLDKKADQLAAINDKKFDDLWRLNVKDCSELSRKISEIDRVLHEQQMGVAPVDRTIDKSSMQRNRNTIEKSVSISTIRTTESIVDYNNPIYGKLLKMILSALANKSGFLTEKSLKSLINTYEDDQRSLVTLNNVFHSLGMEKTEDIDALVDFFLPYCFCTVCTDQIPSRGSFISSGLMSRLMSQVSHMSKTSFSKPSQYYNQSVAELENAWDAIQQSDALIDEIVMEVIKAESLEDDRGNLKIQIREDSRSEDEIQSVLKERMSSRRKTQRWEFEKLSCKYNHPLVISTVYVLSALKDFVIDYHKQIPASSTVAERLSTKRWTPSRLMDDKEIENFWKNLKKSHLKDADVLVWDNLREGLFKYLEILKDRKTISEEVLKLRKRNRDLKKLLAEYVDHGVLMKAPCASQTVVAPSSQINVFKY